MCESALVAANRTTVTILNVKGLPLRIFFSEGHWKGLESRPWAGPQELVNSGYYTCGLPREEGGVALRGPGIFPPASGSSILALCLQVCSPCCLLPVKLGTEPRNASENSVIFTTILASTNSLRKFPISQPSLKSQTAEARWAECNLHSDPYLQGT